MRKYCRFQHHFYIFSNRRGVGNVQQRSVYWYIKTKVKSIMIPVKPSHEMPWVETGNIRLMRKRRHTRCRFFFLSCFLYVEAPIKFHVVDRKNIVVEYVYDIHMSYSLFFSRKSNRYYHCRLLSLLLCWGCLNRRQQDPDDRWDEHK